METWPLGGSGGGTVPAMVSSFSALILLPDFSSSVILICGNGFAGITGNAGGRWIHSFFIIGGWGGGQLTEDGGSASCSRARMWRTTQKFGSDSAQ